MGLWLADLHLAVELLGSKMADHRGGTGFYLNAAEHGISAIPDIPQEARSEAMSYHQQFGGQGALDKLQELDPAIADRLEAGDSQRLVRALEVVLHTGKPLSWQSRPREGGLTGRAIKSRISLNVNWSMSELTNGFSAMIEGGGLAS